MMVLPLWGNKPTRFSVSLRLKWQLTFKSVALALCSFPKNGEANCTATSLTHWRFVRTWLPSISQLPARCPHGLPPAAGGRSACFAVCLPRRQNAETWLPSIDEVPARCRFRAPWGGAPRWQAPRSVILSETFLSDSEETCSRRISRMSFFA